MPNQEPIPAFQIHVAWAVSHKGGTTYRARAHVLETRNGQPVKHTRTVALDDTPEAAMAEAVRYVLQQYARDGLEAPRHVATAGRLTGATLDAHSF